MPIQVIGTGQHMVNVILQNNAKNISKVMTESAYTTQGESIIYLNPSPPFPSTLTISTADIEAQRFPILIKEILISGGLPSPFNPFTINCEGAAKIDGQDEIKIEYPFQWLQIGCDGTNCFIFAKSNEDKLVLDTTSTVTQTMAVIDVPQTMTFGSAIGDNGFFEYFVNGDFQCTRTGDYRVQVDYNVGRNPDPANVSHFVRMLLAGSPQIPQAGVLPDIGAIFPYTYVVDTPITLGNPCQIQVAASSANSGVNELQIVPISSGGLGWGNVGSARLRIWAKNL